MRRLGLLRAFASLLAAGPLAASLSCGSGSLPVVEASAETAPVPEQDDPDDVAVWFDPESPRDSLLATTYGDAGGGLALHDLDGSLLHWVGEAVGLGNVDIRSGFVLGKEARHLAVATSRAGKHNTMAFYSLQGRARPPEKLAVRPFTLGVEAYGTCLFHDARQGRFWFFVTGRKSDGKVQQWEIRGGGDGQLDVQLARSFFVGSRVEGCVADDERGVVYFAEEERGIWRYGARPSAGVARTLVEGTEHGHLAAKIEGLALYRGDDGRGLLVASSQGNEALVFFERGGENGYVGSLRVGASTSVDGASGMESIEVLALPAGGVYPGGVLVVHDDDDDDDGGGGNFKLVPWASVVDALAQR